MELTLSLVLTLLCAAIAWSTKQFRNWLITIGFSASLALCILGAVFSLAWYPWTNLIVLLVAVTGGLLLGRIMPTKLWPFLLLLLVLSMLDIVQILLTSGTPSPGAQSASAPAALLYVNFLLRLPWGRYNIGIGDLLLITAMAEYWRKRGSAFLVALVPGVIGFLLSFGFALFIYNGALPLIPFFMGGWLCSAGLSYYRKWSKGARAQPH